MKLISETEIQAPPGKVFDILTDFAAYGDWNPWIVHIDGPCIEGTRVTVDGLVMGKYRKFRHRILEVSKPDIFRWCDLGWFTVFAFGQRNRQLQQLGNGNTHYRVELVVTGFMAFIVKLFLAKSLENSMNSETVALKEHAERLASAE